MMVKTEQIQVKTRGHGEVIDITDAVKQAIRRAKLTVGTATLFHVGSTAGLTTVEYEPGLVRHDLAAAFERIAPRQAVYQHEQTWHDDNGHAHVRASLLGASLAVPFVDGAPTLGTWQQIVLIDFDTRNRSRTIVCQLIGE
ncbi:MAG: YjbQ family protein [Sedimentisphaerales bacterium]|nr:YjbQ family protein [Sedimentisphaerales bacterium]